MSVLNMSYKMLVKYWVCCVAMTVGAMYYPQIHALIFSQSLRRKIILFDYKYWVMGPIIIMDMGSIEK